MIFRGSIKSFSRRLIYDHGFNDQTGLKIDQSVKFVLVFHITEMGALFYPYLGQG